MFGTVFDNLAQLIELLRKLEGSPSLDSLIDWTHDTAAVLDIMA